MLERYEIDEAEHVITNDLPGVFVRHNVIRRRVLAASGEVMGDERMAAYHALMWSAPFLGR